MATATKLTTMKAIRISSYGGPCAKGCTKAGAIDPRGLDRGVPSRRHGHHGRRCAYPFVAHIEKGGIEVSTMDEPSAEDLDRYGVRADVVASGDSRHRLIDSGDVRPMVGDAPCGSARALEMSRAGHVRGKIVLRIKE